MSYMSALKTLALCALMAFTFQSKAHDSTQPLTLTPDAPSGEGTNCNFFYIDAYDGTVLPTTSTAVLSGLSINLNFYNNGNSSTTTTAAPCSGNYKMVFTIDIEAQSNVSTITVTPDIQKSDGTSIYPASGSTPFLLYPQCNNTNYATTPYCTMNEISGSAVVTLFAGESIKGPSITSDSSIKVTGGQFILYNCPVGSTSC